MATSQRGLCALVGPALSPAGPRWLAADDDDVRVALDGTTGDGERVRDALRLLERDRDGAVGPTVFLLSYEACAALDARLPRRPRDAALGPDVLVRRCRDVAPPPAATPAPAPLSLHAPPEACGRHEARVRQARAHLLDGVIYQANLAHKLVVGARDHDDGLAFFRARTESAAPPCAAFVDLPGWGSVVSLSPERFLCLEERVVRAYPIKGTRPRGRDAVDDARLRTELLASEKDRAEHVMIVDLLRNDLGKVAVPGGVTVERLLEVVSVANVHHLESTVAGRLREDVDLVDLLAATAPGGSITGAPKSTAVEMIAELESAPRGLYTGVLGVVEAGCMRSSLLIRTWLRPDDGPGALHVGGGIVVDSEPAAEWQETLDKAAAFGAVNAR